MEVLESIEVLISAYAPSALIYFIGAKGLAAWLNNNIDTSNWPDWLRETVDWLASANKKAKMTGDFDADQALRKLDIRKEVRERREGKGAVVKTVLKLFS